MIYWQPYSAQIICSAKVFLVAETSQVLSTRLHLDEMLEKTYFQKEMLDFGRLPANNNLHWNLLPGLKHKISDAQIFCTDFCSDLYSDSSAKKDLLRWCLRDAMVFKRYVFQSHPRLSTQPTEKHVASQWQCRAKNPLCDPPASTSQYFPLIGSRLPKAWSAYSFPIFHFFFWLFPILLFPSFPTSISVGRCER